MEEKLIPSLRFPEFTDEWSETTFDSHYSFKPTNSLSRENLNYLQGTVKNIHYGDIHTEFELLFDVSKEKVPFINDNVNIDNIDEENYVLKGDLVIADASEDYADIGKTIEVINTNDESILAGLHTFLARKEDDEIAEGFFGFLLTTYKARLEIMRIAQGTKVLGLSKNRLGKIPLYIPEPDEQKKIANYLKAIDKRIKLLKQKKDALEDYKKSIMQKLFSQKIRFKNEDGSRAPNWTIENLGDPKIASFFKGKGISKNDISKNGRIPCIRYGELYTHYNEVIDKVLSSTNVSEENLVLSEAFDVIIPASGETVLDIATASCVVNSDIALGGDLNIIRPKTVNGLFLAYYLNNSLKNSIAKLAQGISVIHLYKNHLKTLDLHLPSEYEQKKIANFLKAIDRKILLLEEKNDALDDFKNSILQKMFV